jgi:hypothetical protein
MNAINAAILEQDQLEPALWGEAPRMVPRELEPICLHLDVEPAETRAEKHQRALEVITDHQEGVRWLDPLLPLSFYILSNHDLL